MVGLAVEQAGSYVSTSRVVHDLMTTATSFRGRTTQASSRAYLVSCGVHDCMPASLPLPLSPPFASPYSNILLRIHILYVWGNSPLSSLLRTCRAFLFRQSSI